jgi:hypothetical protein
MAQPEITLADLQRVMREATAACPNAQLTLRRMKEGQARLQQRQRTNTRPRTS